MLRPSGSGGTGERLYVTTKASSRKGRNLTPQPEVVLHNGDGSGSFIITGRVDLVEDPRYLERKRFR